MRRTLTMLELKTHCVSIFVHEPHQNLLLHFNLHFCAFSHSVNCEFAEMKMECKLMTKRLALKEEENGKLRIENMDLQYRLNGVSNDLNAARNEIEMLKIQKGAMAEDFKEYKKYHGKRRQSKSSLSDASTTGNSSDSDYDIDEKDGNEITIPEFDMTFSLPKDWKRPQQNQQIPLNIEQNHHNAASALLVVSGAAEKTTYAFLANFTFCIYTFCILHFTLSLSIHESLSIVAPHSLTAAGKRLDI